ncbi:FkbM family methyltransferase [Burkholderia thailandensis]|nr:FkbM family methyltransferase [Burkholderia thailandensis]
MLANRCDVYIGQALIEYGEYCELETQFLQQWINRPGTVVEVGANVGSQTVALAKSAKAVGADVVAFEPQPFVFQNLCANLALNALDNVTAWPFACATQAGTVWFEHQNYRGNGNFGGVSVQTEAMAGGIQMPCVRLDDMIRGWNVYLMKVDVEGFELQVLQGAQETLANNRPVLYVENDRVAQSPALIEYLWGQGYRLWWHISPLFNPQNFRTKADNYYLKLSAFNMVGVPQESNSILHGLEEIVDATAHPLAKRPI